MTFNEVLLLQKLYIEYNKIVKVGDEKTPAQCFHQVTEFFTCLLPVR